MADNTQPEFIGFQKIPRFFRRACITEKIDGTNASITITEDGSFFTGSRNRWITPQDDNYGFSKWAHANKDELMTLGVGTHFGEWWGQGIQRGYGLPEKRFSLFNTSRWHRAGEQPRPILSKNPLADVKYTQPAPDCCYVVPILYDDEFCTFDVEEIISDLKVYGSKAALGFMKPEGIIIYHTAANSYFKVTVEKDEEPKSKSK